MRKREKSFTMVIAMLVCLISAEAIAGLAAPTGVAASDDQCGEIVVSWDRMPVRADLQGV